MGAASAAGWYLLSALSVADWLWPVSYLRPLSALYRSDVALNSDLAMSIPTLLTRIGAPGVVAWAAGFAPEGSQHRSDDRRRSESARAGLRPGGNRRGIRDRTVLRLRASTSFQRLAIPVLGGVAAWMWPQARATGAGAPGRLVMLFTGSPLARQHLIDEVDDTVSRGTE
ncbi:MAG TPA: hypothetical protein VHR97_13160 [Candidatus Baltobacteraceae bacterium]|jgi:hypothetical protein|nr:hypothetical protein [Candidatus Baltobacteraceae bacterium]